MLEDNIKSEESYEFYPLPKIQKPKVTTSHVAIHVIRTHYSKNIIELLSWISENHIPNTPNSASHISKLLNLLQDYSKNYYNDSYSSFLLAIYDGLSFENAWLKFENDVFKIILEYLKVLNNQELNYKKIDKYISKLESIGINVTPY